MPYQDPAKPSHAQVKTVGASNKTALCHTSMHALIALLVACASPTQVSTPKADDKVPQAKAEAPAARPGGANSGNPLAGKKLWFNPNATSATKGLTNLAQPTAVWVLGDTGAAANAVRSAGSELAVLVAYNAPNRDCGNHSAGGTSAEQYGGWIDSLANAIGNGQAVVILEPDALALDCSPGMYQWLPKAVTRLKANPNTYVYIDIGHAGMPGVNEAVDRLNRANVKAADGFALNVSNFYADNELIARANQIIAGLEPLIGKKAHYVIDTSRNGNGSNGDWCNPTGRALGRKPTTDTGTPLMDAALWIKTPGESDGNCNGGPGAGQWFDRLANELNAAPPKDGPAGTGMPAATPVSPATGTAAAPTKPAGTADTKPGALGSTPPVSIPATTGSIGSGSGSGNGSGADCKDYNRDGRTCTDVNGQEGATSCMWDQTWECVQGCAKWVRWGC